MDGGYRSKSYAGGRMQIEPYTGGSGASYQYQYSYSGSGASYQYQYSYGGSGASYQHQYSYSAGTGPVTVAAEEVKRSKSKRRWLALSDPDMERKRRLAAYKAYAVEGKVKGFFRKSSMWLKDRYLRLVYGWS